MNFISALKSLIQIDLILHKKYEHSFRYKQFTLKIMSTKIRIIWEIHILQLSGLFCQRRRLSSWASFLMLIKIYYIFIQEEWLKIDRKIRSWVVFKQIYEENHDFVIS